LLLVGACVSYVSCVHCAAYVACVALDGNPASRWNSADDSDRVDVESGEVGDGRPLGVDEGRVGVEDDVAQTVRQQGAGAQRPDEVDQPDLVRVAAGAQHEDDVLRELALAHRLTVLHPTQLTVDNLVPRSYQGRRSLWDRGDTSPQYLDWGDMITNVPPPQYF